MAPGIAAAGHDGALGGNDRSAHTDTFLPVGRVYIKSCYARGRGHGHWHFLRHGDETQQSYQRCQAEDCKEPDNPLEPEELSATVSSPSESALKSSAHQDRRLQDAIQESDEA
ncbi:hypothetical protein ASPCADRAFT_10824 [Aspergillus carbonarius ITEM 5010]|uniref:Uncharacterized protein n=1 Tax=Aspergillus carbonarius (strain ITEM 5010) TaxID=602072 RepID=A0A1R3R6Y5_ASPC5|nr:hypothetical protein ASPCADRAFT_10824 [Aspergillus carbonarius ITEM 5010]